MYTGKRGVFMSVGRGKLTLMVLLAVVALSFLGYAASAGTGGDPGGSGDPLVTRSFVDQYVQWKVAELNTGQVLRGRAGSELILRRGQAAVVDPTGNGVIDLTAGVDIFARGEVPANHLLVIPREDGRGIKAESPVVVMYRGGAVLP